MANNDSSMPKDWFAKGDADIQTVEILLGHEGNMEVAASHIQQAIEKYLKGYLISKGWELKKTHDLAELLDKAVEYNPELEEFRGLCEESTAFYFGSRYPLFQKGPSKEEVEEALKKARALIDAISEEV
ncbi:MAG: HEPN domain-containing protein [Candidatus Altiarchaeales archaeon]|nr:HEPN domain-containing protein [Candidatus Altiarchaeota archaeon]MBU4266931.1 HEPN domain-containing protein [Candidatus Altiarchaeota archaeon]MCG2782702.1 HEPN domain-containing protein [Candidatus Altiarchaeales archaeon]